MKRQVFVECSTLIPRRTVLNLHRPLPTCNSEVDMDENYLQTPFFLLTTDFAVALWERILAHKRMTSGESRAGEMQLKDAVAMPTSCYFWPSAFRWANRTIRFLALLI